MKCQMGFLAKLACDVPYVEMDQKGYMLQKILEVQSRTRPPVTTDSETSENCLVLLFTKGGAVPLLT